MADMLSEKEVVLLHQAIAYGKASKLAQVIYTLENVMTYIKNLLLENAENPVIKTNKPAPSPTTLTDKVKDELPDEENSKVAETPGGSPKSDSESGAVTLEDQEVESDDVTQEEDSSAAQADTGSIARKLTEMTTKSTKVVDKHTLEVSVNKPKNRKTQPKHADVKSAEAMFTCEKCGYQTKRKDHFKRHCISHTGDKPFKCHLCQFSSADKYHLIRHLKSSLHNNSSTRSRGTPLECETCEYKTHQVGRMERHKRTHSGEKPFACSYCAYRAAQRATLERHILTHTGEKPFKCEKCEYSAADTKSLRFHTLQKHGDGTVHRCPECDYSTPVLRYFKLHMRAHSDARPYLCDMCGYAAKRPHGLTKHYRAMHGWTLADTDGKTYRRAPHPDSTEPPFPTSNSNESDGIESAAVYQTDTSTKADLAPSYFTSHSDLDTHTYTGDAASSNTTNQSHAVTALVTNHHQPITALVTNQQPITGLTPNHNQPITSNLQPISGLTANHQQALTDESCSVDTYMDSLMPGCHTSTSNVGSTNQENEQTGYPFYL